MADKILKYRIFEDDTDKMNLPLTDIDGEIIIVSQFTLTADIKKVIDQILVVVALLEIAKQKFKEFENILRKKYNKIQTGIFGADMKVSFTNDGPVTFSFNV